VTKVLAASSATADAILMSSTSSFRSSSVHRVSSRWRWFTVIAVPSIGALVAWGTLAFSKDNPLIGGSTEFWVVVWVIAILAVVALSLIGALIWAFRARVIIDGDQMRIRGAVRTTTITADRMEGFRYLNKQLIVYSKDRNFAVQIAYFENMPLITMWVKENTYDIVAEMLKEEELEISNDVDLGMTDEARSESLNSLQNRIICADTLVFIAAGAVTVNYFFFEDIRVELVAITVLIMIPILLCLFAIMNRGQVRIDQDEGSRYPEIFTALMASGITLGFFSLLDRGALLDNSFYELLVVAVIVNGLIWCFIDAGRLAKLWARGRSAGVMSAVTYFAMSGFWSGGFLYQVNKHLDASPTEWHATQVVQTTISSGKITIYSVTLAPWDSSQDEPVEYLLRRDEFDEFEEGMPVVIGVRAGALNMAWAAALKPRDSSTLLVGTDETPPDESGQDLQ
jgi:hypothetical protein